MKTNILNIVPLIATLAMAIPANVHAETADTVQVATSCASDSTTHTVFHTAYARQSAGKKEPSAVTSPYELPTP